METGGPSGFRKPAPSSFNLFKKLKVTNIPSITDLRQKLDYGHAHQQRDIMFYNTARSYIFNFTSSEGIPGSDLLRWKYSSHQTGLLEMTSKFLDQDAKGLFFWPDDPSSPNYGKLQYSTESRQIQRLLIQLFFKINQQQKWKGNQRATSEPQALERTSPSHQISDRPSWSAVNSQQPNSVGQQQQTDVNNHQRGHRIEDAIDLESFVFRDDCLAETKPDKAACDAAATSPTELPAASQLRLTLSSGNLDNHAQDPPEESRILSPSAQAAPIAQMNDPFHSPDSLGSDIPLAFELAYNRTKRLAPHGYDKETPQAKRLRSEHDAPTEAGTRSPEGTTTNAPTGTAPSRPTSSRRRNAPINKDMVTGTEYIEALEPQCSPTPAASVSSIGLDDSQASVPPPPSVPEAPPHGEPPQSTTGNDSQSTESRNEDHLPLPAVPDSAMAPKPSPIPQLGKEHDEEPPKQARHSMPKVNLIFSVNVSQNLNKVWTPKDTFQGLSLEELIAELPLEKSIQGLNFVLEVPGKRFETEVLLGDEDGFETMKVRFLQKMTQIRKLSHGSSTKTLHFEISISPLRDGQNEAVREFEGVEDDDLIVF